MAKLIFKCRYIKPNRGANYLRYIATRDGVEKYASYIDGRPNSHGLFSDADEPISLEKVMREVAAHDGAIYTPIISLRREDAARLGFDNAAGWRNLLRSHAATFAEQFKIPPGDLRWYAAFHNEGHHPHCHMILYSAGQQGYLTRKGLDDMRSALARDVFKQDLMQIYEQQTQHRDNLRREAGEIFRQIAADRHSSPAVDDLLRKLAKQLAACKGKKVYGYLPTDIKTTVDRIADEFAKDDRIAQLYSLWYDQREAMLSTYRDDMPERVPLSENNAFKAIKNAVIQEVLCIEAQHAQANQAAHAVLGQLADLLTTRILQEPLPQDAPTPVESKLWQEEQAHRQAQGLR